MIEEYDKKKNKCICYWIILAIVVTLFIGVIGILIGAALSGVILSALSAVIVLAIVLGILAILQGILLSCVCNRKKKEDKCC